MDSQDDKPYVFRTKPYVILTKFRGLDHYSYFIGDETGQPIPVADESGERHSVFIVTAANAHADLVATCKQLRDRIAYIRESTWPVAGLGIQLLPHELDADLETCAAVLKRLEPDQVSVSSEDKVRV